jgi:hypothetical protein
MVCVQYFNKRWLLDERMVPQPPIPVSLRIEQYDPVPFDDDPEFQQFYSMLKVPRP